MQNLRAPQTHQGVPQDPGEIDIDFTAALCDNPNSPLIDNNIYINNNSNSNKEFIGRGSKNIELDINLQGNHEGIEEENIIIPEIVEDTDFNLKSQLTVKELRFLELYMSGDYTIEKAMELAGYLGYHKKSLYRIGRKIVEKHESQAGDHRKIMRAMGYGEVKILQLLINSAEKAKSETVKLNARIALAKCIGLHKDVVDGVEGITIIFAPANSPDKPDGPQPGQPPAVPPQKPGPTLRMIK
jgi:hypothetical protein